MTWVIPDAYEHWAQTLPSLLHRTTSGIPLHVLDALVLSMERGVLARASQVWHSVAPDTLEKLLEQGATLPRRIEALSHEERTLLLILAVAGEPCTRDRIQRAIAPTPIDLDHVFAQLERAGYVKISVDRCAIAHDTLTDAVLALASADDRRRVHAELATAALHYALQQGDALAGYTMRAAIAHALRSDEDHVVRVVFRAYVSRSRKNGDSRPLAQIASDALGEADSPADRARLIAALPKRQRVLQGIANRWTFLASAAAIAVIAGLFGAWLATRAPTPDPDGELVLMRADSTGHVTLFALPLSSANWVPGSPIVTDKATPFLTLPNDPMLWGAVPTGRREGEWIGTMMPPDSGVTDLYLFETDAPPRRLTASRGDDTDPSVSPDGGQVVFASARWSALAARSLAILDLNTGLVSRLTADAGSDGTPIWSPDGRRVAFARTASDGIRLCLVDTDGLHTECPRPPKPPSSVRPRAWPNDSILLVELSGQLVRAHVDSGTFSIVDTARAARIVSADGRWLVTARQAPSGSGAVCEVSLASNPANARPLKFSSERGAECVSVLFGAPSVRRHYIDALFIEPIGSDPVVGVPHRLSVKAVDAQGDSLALAIRDIDWSSSDTTIAWFDHDGLLHPRKPGAITVRVSYGGWRKAERHVEIRMPSSRVLLYEPWTGNLATQWSPFGDPSPRTVDTNDGQRAFLNNGDGVFQSGVHSKRAFPLRGGLALDTWLSTPITMEQWQVARIGLYGDVDSVGLARWNHRDGWAFAPERQHYYMCEFLYPSGTEGMHSYATRYLTAQQQHTAPPAWSNGARFRVRLQIFPDGRCGAAVDGRAVAIGTVRPAPVNGTAHVYLYGNSPNTRILVGTVVVTEGVPAGVNWFKVDGAARAAGAARPKSLQGRRE